MKGHRAIDSIHLESWNVGLLERTDHMMRRMWGKLWYGFSPRTEVVLRMTQVDERPSEGTRRTFVRELRVRSYQDKLLWRGPQRRWKQKPWTKEEVDGMKVELLLPFILRSRTGVRWFGEILLDYMKMPACRGVTSLLWNGLETPFARAFTSDIYI